MDLLAFFPFLAEADMLELCCKLPPHSGAGSLLCDEDPNHPLAKVFARVGDAMNDTKSNAAEQSFSARFIMPATGNSLLVFRWPSSCPLSRNVGHGLTVCGNSADGPFRLECPEFHVRATSGPWEKPGWAVAAPHNVPATITYGVPRPVCTVVATINNFDFQYGNVPEVGQGKVLRVQAAGRAIDFAWRESRAQLRHLLDARVIHSAALSTFSFAACPGATDDELTTFANCVASLCCYVVGQHTCIPLLSFLDADGRIIRRTLREAVQSPFRSDCALPALHFDDGLPQLFRQCFDEHVRMQATDLWRRLPFLWAAIEDPPYLEQKYATLMMGVELLIRSSLIESGKMSAEEGASKNLAGLIGAARGLLRWDIPKHYTEEDRYRVVRNAVDHGDSLPHNTVQVRHDYDKWRLFLRRRILLRLGYDGKVASPQQGFAASSPADEFSEEHNSFHP